MKNNKPLFIFVLLVLFLSSCVSKRHLKTHEEETKQELTYTNNKFIDSINVNTIDVLDTTKKKDSKILVRDVKRIEREFSEDGSKKKDIVTEYKETELYFSEEDKFFCEHGFDVDSLKKRDTTTKEVLTDTVVKDKDKSKKIHKEISILFLILVIILSIVGYNTYKSNKVW